MHRWGDDLTDGDSALRRKLATLDRAAGDALRGRFFVVPAGAPRDRRPTDTTMLVLSTITFVVFALRSRTSTGVLENALIAVADSLPAFLDPVWRVVHDGLAVWVIVLLVTALLRRQWRLLASMAGAVVIAHTVGAVLGRILTGSWPDLLEGPFGIDPDTRYPALTLASLVSVTSVASVYLSRPYRLFGRLLVAGAAIAWVVLGSTTPGGTVGAIALGLACASAMHLILGSPAGVPTLGAVQKVLASMGIEATPHDLRRSNGVVLVRASGADGTEFDVKIYGRDAWDGQLLVKLWRFFWYRDSGATLALSRLQQVEHEAFLTLLAERQGVPVDSVVTAGTNVIGDGVLVVKRKAPLVSETTDEPSDEQLVALWSALDRLHDVRIAHGSIDAEHLRLGDGVAGIADLASGYMADEPSDFLADRAQLLITTATLVGNERAIAVARRVLGDEGLADVSSFVQPAVLTAEHRKRRDETGLEVDVLRKLIVEQLGIDQRDLQKLRRLSVSGVVTSAILFFAGYILISQLTEVGLDTIIDAVSEASFPIIVGAFLVSSFGRVMGAVGLSGISPTPVPLGRLTTLQFAQTFVSLAMPSTAGRVAVNIRFFQRNGVEPTTAVAMGALDGFTGFVCQIILLSSIFLFGLGSLDLNLDEIDPSKAWTLLVWAGVAIVIGIITVIVVRPLRNWVLDKVTKVKDFLLPFLKSPRRLAIALGANMASELIGALTLFTVLTAFGQNVDYIPVVIVSISVSLFAGLMPVPGGIGVTEAALTAGFIAIGVPEDIAFAAALTCRVVTYYFPPVIGAVAFRSLRRQGFL